MAAKILQLAKAPKSTARRESFIAQMASGYLDQAFVYLKEIYPENFEKQMSVIQARVAVHLSENEAFRPLQLDVDGMDHGCEKIAKYGEAWRCDILPFFVQVFFYGLTAIAFERQNDMENARKAFDTAKEYLGFIQKGMIENEVYLQLKRNFSMEQSKAAQKKKDTVFNHLVREKFQELSERAKKDSLVKSKRNLIKATLAHINKLPNSHEFWPIKKDGQQTETDDESLISRLYKFLKENKK